MTAPASASFIRSAGGYAVWLDETLLGRVERLSQEWQTLSPKWGAYALDGTNLGTHYRTRRDAAEAVTVAAARLAEVEAIADAAEPTVEEFGAALDAQTDEEAAAEGWVADDEEELTDEQVAEFRAEVADALTVEADLPPTDDERVTVRIRARELRPGDLVVDSLGGHRYAAFDVALDDTPRPVPTVKVWTAIRDQEAGLPPVITVPAASEVLVLRPLSDEGRELLAAFGSPEWALSLLPENRRA